MKQLLFLLLFPCLALAQYPNNGNQKITLGEQTTADGLVFRGVANDTNIITPFSDTSAYIILDTIDSKFYHYNRTTTYWALAGGGGGTTIDTASMLTNYYRAGRNGIIQVSDVPTLNQNTTGSAATLTTSRTIQINLASTSSASFNGSANITPGVTGTLPVANGGTGQNTLTANKVMVGNGTSGVTSATNLTWDNTNSRLGIGVTNPLSAIHTNGVFTAGSVNVGYVNLKGFLWGTSGLEQDYRWQSDAISNPNNDLIFQSRGYANSITGGNVFNLNYYTGAMRIYSLSGTGLRPLSAAADGTLTVSSSITIKENVSNLNYGLDKIMQLQPKSFNYIDKNKYGEGLDIGFIAEDVYSIVPEATGIMNDGFIYFDAVRLIPILTKAIQEQTIIIKQLEDRIKKLEEK